MLTVLIVIFGGCGCRSSAEIFTTVGNGWKSITIIIKSYNLDIGRVSGSTAGRE